MVIFQISNMFFIQTLFFTDLTHKAHFVGVAGSAITS